MGKIKPADNESNQRNSNKDTSGFNKQYLDAFYNKSNQKNPNNPEHKKNK